MASLLCPRCPRVQRIALSLTTTRALSAHACQVCHGVWIDPTAYKELIVDGGLRDDVAPGHDIPVDDVPGALFGCPVCAAQMVREPLGPVTVDRCAEHGIWFDADELGAALDWAVAEGHADAYRQEISWLQSARLARSSPPAPRHSRGARALEVADTVVHGAGEVAKVILRIALFLLEVVSE